MDHCLESLELPSCGNFLLDGRYHVTLDVNRWKTLVANRVALISYHSTLTQCNHVGTTENLADYATRGLSLEELKDFKL